MPNRPVRAVGVVVVHELAEDSHKVTPAQNWHAVKALAADGPHESFGDRICSGRSDWCPDDKDALGVEDLVEAGCELGISVSNEPPRRDRPVGAENPIHVV